MVVTLWGISMLARLVQSENAQLPIVVTLWGKVKALSFLPVTYCTNSFPSLVYKLPSMDIYAWLFSLTVMLARLVQPENANLPMVVTPSGISMLVRLVQ